MGHSRHQALALIDLWVMQRAQPRGPLEGSLGCKYNSVYSLDRHIDKGGSDGKKRVKGNRYMESASFCHSPTDLSGPPFLSVTYCIIYYKFFFCLHLHILLF